MTFLGWMALTAGVMLLMAFASSYLRNLPISSSAVYLAIGLAIGPVGFDLASFDVIRSAIYVERVTEIAVIVALFVGGLRLRRAWSDPAWHAAFLLDPEAPDHAHDEHPPAEAMVPARVDTEAMGEPAVAAGVLMFETLSFGDTIERLVEVGLIVIVGVALVDHWDPRALALAGALFVVIRPLAAQLVLRATRTTSRQRWLMGWFGIRGIGSLYYLGYALGHGVTGAAAIELADLTISVIAISVVVHGISTTPLLTRYERMLERTKQARAAAQSSSVAARS